MIKMILCDMDGTLLKDNKEIQDGMPEMIEYCENHGVIFGIASGRQYDIIKMFFPEHYMNMMFVCDNGGTVYYKDKQLFFKPFERKNVLDIVDEAEKMDGIFPYVSTLNHIYIDSKDQRLLDVIKKYSTPADYIESFDMIVEPMSKITLCDIHGVKNVSYPYFRKMSDQYEVTLSGDIWLDIAPKGTNKGNGLRQACKVLSIDPEDTIAFGDHMNDKELLEYAGCGYAMKNAYPDLLSFADKVTEYTNNESGIVHTLEGLIKSGLL